MPIYRRIPSYSNSELKKDFPHLHEALTELLERRKGNKDLINLHIAFNFQKKGKDRRINLGTVIETLKNYGYEVEIKPSKN